MENPSSLGFLVWYETVKEPECFPESYRPV